MAGYLRGAASPMRARRTIKDFAANERPNQADVLTQVGVLLAIMLALGLVAQILFGAPS